MKLLILWALAGVAFAVLWVLRLVGVIDLGDGLFYCMGVVGYMLGLATATWAIRSAMNAEKTLRGHTFSMGRAADGMRGPN